MAESYYLRLSDSITAVFFVCFFFFFFFSEKNKAVLFIKVSFPMRFSSTDHLNIIPTYINIYLDYILPKIRCKTGHHKAILPLRACLLISENCH